MAITISTVIKNPSPPLRVTVGRGVEQMIELRSRHNDEEWLDLWSSETGDFLTRWKSLTGDDLTELPDR